ncbi:hypothetical protein HWV62_31005 [Athelia sp. TMB]|nr:hypothetical protein HWV62_31005 [Athelia sp. TMB]
MHIMRAVSALEKGGQYSNSCLSSKITRREGAVRLSIDDGPAHTEFLEDDFDEDAVDDEPLALADRALVGGDDIYTKSGSTGRAAGLGPSNPEPPVNRSP